MQCDICWQEFKEYELISMGCCTLKLCKECIANYTKCPSCKREYLHSKKIEDLQNKYNQNEINYQKEILYLASKNLQYTEHNKHLLFDNANLKNDIKFMKLDLDNRIYDNIKLQTQLNILTEYINNDINDINRKKDIKNIIEKYNLL
jgi:hypothetical protein